MNCPYGVGPYMNTRNVTPTVPLRTRFRVFPPLAPIGANGRRNGQISRSAAVANPFIKRPPFGTNLANIYS